MTFLNDYLTAAWNLRYILGFLAVAVTVALIADGRMNR